MLFTSSFDILSSEGTITNLTEDRQAQKGEGNKEKWTVTRRGQ